MIARLKQTPGGPKIYDGILKAKAKKQAKLIEGQVSARIRRLKEAGKIDKAEEVMRKYKTL